MGNLNKALLTYGDSDYYPFHMPGHKRNSGSSEGLFAFERDITEIEGFDNLHHAEGILLEAQKDAAALFGVRESFYSINGSTAGLLAAISACVKKGGRILVARNCHKAVYHGIYLRDLKPVYLYPSMEPTFGINGGILSSDVEHSLEENPDIQAILITSPTYDGVVSDIKKIAEVAHTWGIPLIVDEAHGAHFLFSSYFPLSATQLGADLVIQSVHKTLPSMTQTAILHRCSDRVNRELLLRFLGMYETSSPSYILMASIDACVNKLKQDGTEMFENYTKMLDETRKALKECRSLRLITEDIAGSCGIYDYDRSKILISTVGCRMNGNQLSSRLREKYHLEMEMAGKEYVTALTSVGDTREGFDRLKKAVLEIDLEAEPQKEKVYQSEGPCLRLPQEMTIGEAMDAETREYALKDCVGKVSAEFAYVYPPGIPIVVPGERMTGQFLENVRRYQACGFVLEGLSDYQNQKIKAVRE